MAPSLSRPWSPSLQLLLDRVASPIGTILLVSDGEALRALYFEDHEPRMRQQLRRLYGSYSLTPAEGPATFREALRAYFAGDLAAPDRLSVQTGGTEFQRRVWAALRPIPPGTTTTYGRLAAELGRASASRAVGFANGANPVSIVVPCHRVVGADASLTGYGGGLERKAWLLDHERRYASGAALI
ncbi:methylated-DNA--[protein]-cysteine S-methyltransferase [Roseomonas hellenica]|nr:methylated-DNA--[protein]-cysteine S-methyltransferase [Plastoroseomonas hellenica]